MEKGIVFTQPVINSHANIAALRKAFAPKPHYFGALAPKLESAAMHPDNKRPAANGITLGLVQVELVRFFLILRSIGIVAEIFVGLDICKNNILITIALTRLGTRR